MLKLENYKDAFSQFGKRVNLAILDQEDKIETSEFDFSKYRDKIPSPDLLNGLDGSMALFYSHVVNWKLRWHTRSNLDFRLEGSINILPLEEIHAIGEESFMPNNFPVMKDFRLLDYFYNEGAVGFYLGQPERGLFYFEFDADPQPLEIDFSGYLDLLVYTRGVGYWQLLIREILENRVKPGTANIYEHLPKLFPEFSEEGFIKLYESVRLR